MILMTLRLNVAAERIADVITISKSLGGPLSADPGCKEFVLYSDVTKDDALVLIAEWKTQEALDEHIQSKDFLKILALMELSTNTPVINFLTISNSAGFEMVEALRG